MGSPPAHCCLFDGRTTLAARLSFPVVNKKVFLMAALAPLTILIIPERGTAVADSRLDD